MSRRRTNGEQDVDPNYLQFLNQLQAGEFMEDQEPDEDEDDDDDDETEEEENEEEEVILFEELPRVSQTYASTSGQVRSEIESEIIVVDDECDKERRRNGGEACSSGGVECKGGSQENEWNRGEIDGLFCSICMEAWTSDGDHHICCLPCGHIYGMSCIRRWLWQCKSSGKCPQCNRKCTLKDVRKLFTSRIAIMDEESQKRIQSLEAKCDLLEKKDANWCKKESEWNKSETALRMKIHQLTERTTYLERLLEDRESRQSGLLATSGGCQGQSVSGQSLGSNLCRRGSSSNFMLQTELRVDGARLFDVDTSSQNLIIARRQIAMGGTYVLTKMSLIPPHESENILLPLSTKLVRDLHISPVNGSLALFSSLGKKLSVLSTESNNVVLTYDLSAPAWSCSWDLNSSHYVYAGLQNGFLLVFDIRQTMRPMESLEGLSSNPIHTIHSLVCNSSQPAGTNNVLTASSIGLCRWKFGGIEGGPHLVPETGNQGVCISVAYCPNADVAIASYRPRVEMFNEMTVSQPSLTPSSGIGKGVRGSHVLYEGINSSCYQKLGSVCANVNDVRLPKTAIIDMEDQTQLFASEDEVTSELVLQDLPSFEVVQGLRMPKRPIYDMKYTHAFSQGLLGCLSDNTLQLFSPMQS